MTSNSVVTNSTGPPVPVFYNHDINIYNREGVYVLNQQIVTININIHWGPAFHTTEVDSIIRNFKVRISESVRIASQCGWITEGGWGSR